MPEIDKLIAKADKERRLHASGLDARRAWSLMGGRWEAVSENPAQRCSRSFAACEQRKSRPVVSGELLEKVDLPHLKALFIKLPKVINEPLVYGAHSHKTIEHLGSHVARKDPELVKATIAAGADLNQELNETTPLSTAISVNSVLRVDQLIKAGADVAQESDSRTRSLMHVALMQGSVDIAKRLAVAGISHDIFSKCGLGMLDAVQQELDANPSSGLQYDVAGNIPLSYAVACNQAAVVRLLLKRHMTAETGSPARESPVEFGSQVRVGRNYVDAYTAWRAAW